MSLALPTTPRSPTTPSGPYSDLRAALDAAAEDERQCLLRLRDAQDAVVRHYLDSPGTALPDHLDARLERDVATWQQAGVRSASLRAALASRIAPTALREQEDALRLPLEAHDINEVKPRSFAAEDVTLSPKKLYRSHPPSVPQGVVENIQGVPITSLHLKKLFDAVDKDQKGYLTEDEVVAECLKVDSFGVPWDERRVKKLIAEACRWGRTPTPSGQDRRISFEEYSVVRLRIGQL